MGLPCQASGMNGAGGAWRSTAQTVISSGASAQIRRRPRSSSAASSIGWMISPDSTSGPRACRRNSKAATTPKLPPPPRSAQKRSGFSSALARRSRPSAVTTSAATRLSMVSPNLRVIQPKPPPRVSPAMPVVELIPVGTASPWAWVAASRSASVAPGDDPRRPASGSTATERICDRSRSSAPSATASPAIWWPPPRTASSRPLSRAKSTVGDDVVGRRGPGPPAPGAGRSCRSRACAPRRSRARPARRRRRAPGPSMPRARRRRAPRCRRPGLSVSWSWSPLRLKKSVTRPKAAAPANDAVIPEAGCGRLVTGLDQAVQFSG